MSLKHSLIAGAVIGTVGLASAAGIGLVSADTSDTTSGQQGLVDKLATKFHLKREDVQAVFDQDRADHEAAHQAKVSERLQALVTDGTITSAQKSAIETKLTQLAQQRNSDRKQRKDLSESERRNQMEQQRSELEAWAKQQGLDMGILKGVMMPGGHGDRPHDMTRMENQSSKH